MPEIAEPGGEILAAPPTGGRCRMKSTFRGQARRRTSTPGPAATAAGLAAAAHRRGRIAAGTDGRAQGTTAAGQFGAEGVRDLRLLVQMAVLATPTELERLAEERDASSRGSRASSRTRSASRTPRTSWPTRCPSWRPIRACPSGGRRRRNYLRRALQRDALDELRRRYGRNLQDGAREFVPIADAGELTDAGAGARRASSRRRRPLAQRRADRRAHAEPPAARRRRGPAAEVPRAARARRDRRRARPQPHAVRAPADARQRARAATR